MIHGRDMGGPDSKDSEELSVTEGNYSAADTGPSSDTGSFDTSSISSIDPILERTPPGVQRREEEVVGDLPSLRDHLQPQDHSKPAAPIIQTSRGVPVWVVPLVAAIGIVLLVGALAALFAISRSLAPDDPVQPAVEAPAEPGDDHGGIEVKRGLKHTPKPPKTKTGPPVEVPHDPTTGPPPPTTEAPPPTTEPPPPTTEAPPASE